MKRYLLFFLIIPLCSVVVIGQHTNILIDENGSWTQPEEPSIMVSPYNTDHMVGGANINNVYYSTDGGFTWNTSALSSTYGVWGDPAIIVDIDEEIPSLLSLEQNYPNPFRESTVISFKLTEPTSISLRVIDVYGRVVATIQDNEYINAGKHMRVFTPEDYNLSTGLYYFSLESDHSVMKKKMIFVK